MCKDDNEFFPDLCDKDGRKLVDGSFRTQAKSLARDAVMPEQVGQAKEAVPVRGLFGCAGCIARRERYAEGAEQVGEQCLTAWRLHG